MGDKIENCRNCGWLKFDELWGEYKCLARSFRIQKIMTKAECEFYKPRNEKEAQDDRSEE